MIEYGFVVASDQPFEQVNEKVVERLKGEGFGILCEIDVQAKLQEKLGVDIGRYVILGACNPPFAHRALQVEENIGLMLPCNVILYERGEETVVGVIKPSVAMQMINNEELGGIALQIEERLQRVIEAL